ncbi:MAG: flagellar hook-associated protein 3 [Pseudomonadota bacterium]|jgi:flagellar hook-associated protein 3 FlgL
MTRIATHATQEAGLDALQRRQADLTRAQRQLVSGRRVERASDDPAAAVRIERAATDQARAETLRRAIGASQAAMAQVESATGQAVSVVQEARDTLLAAGNGAHGPGERQALAAQLRALRGQLLQLANTADPTGQPLFGGPGAGAGVGAAFADTAAGVRYLGVRGEASASPEAPLPVAVDGADIWLGARTGNGVFATSAATGPASSAWIAQGEVTDPSALALADGERYELRFDGPAAYTVTRVRADGRREPFPSAGADAGTLVPGQAIDRLPGMRVTVGGTPAAGDVFTVEPSTPTLDIFGAIDRAAAVLETAGTSAHDLAAVTQAVQTGLGEFDQGLGRLQAARSRAGASLNHLEALDNRTSMRVLSAQETRSEAEDLDMAQAISAFTGRQTAYQAALQSYAMVQKLSLFDYISP